MAEGRSNIRATGEALALCASVHGDLGRGVVREHLGELDDQPFGTADVDEPIDVLVVADLTDQVEALGLAAGQRFR